jgi:hypothetical protein
MPFAGFYRALRSAMMPPAIRTPITPTGNKGYGNPIHAGFDRSSTVINQSCSGV